MTNEKIFEMVRAVCERDLLLNTFFLQIMSSYENKHYMLAFVGTIIVLEYVVKYSANMRDGEFHAALTKISGENKITPEEHIRIQHLKEIRNKLFHENPHSVGYMIDDKISLFSENSTYEHLLSNHFVEVLQIMKKLHGSGDAE